MNDIWNIWVEKCYPDSPDSSSLISEVTTPWPRRQLLWKSRWRRKCQPNRIPCMASRPKTEGSRTATDVGQNWLKPRPAIGTQKKQTKKSPRCDTSQVSNKAIICMASYWRYRFSLLVLFVSFCFALFCHVLWKVILSAISHWLHLQATAWCRGRDQKWSSPHPEGNILHKPRPVSVNFRRVKSCKSLVVSKSSKWSEVKN